MLNLLSIKRQKLIAWFLFFLFYSEMIAMAYAAKRNAYIQDIYRPGYWGNFSASLFGNDNTATPKYISDNSLNTLTRESLLESPGNDGYNKLAEKSTATEIIADEAELGPGPGQPEMATFKSIGADNMVNLFTGDFSYNIPLLDVDGYPINIFYNAGPTMDQEASWVGLGWNINPGTINRNMRGIPDDFDGSEKILKEQSIKPDRTVGVSASPDKEMLGTPNTNWTFGAFINNRRGLGLEVSANKEFAVHKNLSVHNKDEKTQNEPTIEVGATLNSQTGLTPAVGFKKYLYTLDASARNGLGASIDFNSRTGLGDLRLSSEATIYKTKKMNEEISNELFGGGKISFARTSYTPSITMPLTNVSATFTAKLGKERNGETKSISITGYYINSSIAERDREQKKPAYGYMYYEKGNGDKNALLDFNRLNDGSYNKKTPIISVPVYTYDVFSISGEGTGGTFRGYRGNMGNVRDHETSTRTGKLNIAVDFAAGSIVKGGTVIGGVYSANNAGEWSSQNVLKNTATFKTSDKDVQSGFYFKNPGETAIIDEDYYNSMGADKLMRPVMGTTSSNNPPFNNPLPTLQSKFRTYGNDRKADGTISVGKDTYRKERDKRTQVISFLTANEADKVGLDRYIYSYETNKTGGSLKIKPGSCNPDPVYKATIRRFAQTSGGIVGLFETMQNAVNPTDYRKKNHISEITVLQNGQRYIYGLPVYQIRQQSVIFSVDNSNSKDASRGTVSFKPDYDYATGVSSTRGDDSEENSKGKDHFFQSETTPGFAHSFLLTAILSPDYSDLTGDGITDDDLGTSVKFNYTKINKRSSSPNSWNSFKWRMPIDQPANSSTAVANYNRGLVTDTQDDKAMYTYGEKELWYTHSIETKNMIAIFFVSDRKDGYGVQNVKGVLNTRSDATIQQKLDRIDLYLKADLIDNPAKARPVKSVHFTYSYKLCRNYPLFYNGGTPTAENGKLTLETIYFTYRNNNHQKNKYVFKYKEQDNASLVYNASYTDRWGIYKSASDNPEAMSNEDFPYTVQDKAKADASAAVWSLSEILLPSGAKITVNYEADDYAFVQNKRACRMTSILGFGNSPSATPNDKLFQQSSIGNDYDYVFFRSAEALSGPNVIKELYLQDLKHLLLKLWVQVPKDQYGSGYEPIIVYCNVEEYGVVAGGDNKTFYIRIGKNNNKSQIMETVYQFLRDHLPSKAYYGSDLGESGGVVQLAKALFAMVNNIRTGVLGFETSARMDNWCRVVDLDKSFARLNDPTYYKYGGGHRVKSVIITDNWKKMTAPEGANDIASYYGQEYSYTSTSIVGSSTVSSGVASYEPGVGNEENPFRDIKQYSRTNPLGPTALGNIEEPVTEMFFPSPQVGYSKVTVKSIHNKTNKAIKSGVGSQETHFYTTRDFPVISDFTDFDTESRFNSKPGFLNQAFNFAQKDYMTLLQGFRVVLNDMNGKVKMQASYPENDLNHPINKTTYYYRTTKTGENKYRLNNILPVIDGPGGKIYNKLVGKDIEVMNDFREHFSYTHAAQVPVNVDFFTAGGWPLLLPSIFRAVFRNESKFRSATTLKVVTEYGILDSIETIDKGSIAGTRNLVYDAETGNVLVSRTSNEFNHPVYNFNYPAYWAYEGMGPAYKNIDASFKNILFRNGKIEKGLTPAEITQYFQSGDEIYVSHNNNVGPKDNPACIGLGSGTACTPLPLSGEYRIWALDISKDGKNPVVNPKEFIFIDRYGNPFNASDADIRIIRSGRRNLMDASVGSVTSMASPIKLVPGTETWDKIEIANNTNVVQTGAVEFKEKWKTEDALYYVKDTTVIEDRLTSVFTDTIYLFGQSDPGSLPESKHIARWRYHARGANYQEHHEANNKYFFARHQSDGESSDQTRFDDRSWIKLKLGSLANVTIQSAKINLYPHIHSGPFPHKFYYHNTRSSDNWPANKSHNTSDAHFNNKQYIQRDFVLERLQGKWPTTVFEWSSNYLFQSPSADDRVVVPHPVQGVLLSNSDPALNIDITRMLQRMIRDYHDPAKLYDPAIRISMLTTTTTKHDTRVCFDLEKGGSGRIIFNYSNCDSLLPVGYVPGPGEQVAVCKSPFTYKICKSVFTRDYMNPYVQGLLGNWRPVKSHIYYSDRREQDPTTATTNIAQDGILKDFETFWNLDPANKQLTKTSSTKWVWNTETTQYNRKGAEVENKDALLRYNAVVFGYNQALPVATVNNSKLRLSTFDGFEDYKFKDQACELDCPISHRHFDTKINTALLDETQAHTGKYSLKTSAQSATTINIKISEDNNINDPNLEFKQVQTVTNFPDVTLKGVGLTGLYFNQWPLNWQETPHTVREDAELVVRCIAHDNSNGCVDHGNLPDGMRCGNIGLKWQGKLQVEYSGWYYFASFRANDYSKIIVNDTVRYHKATDAGDPGNQTAPTPVWLDAGDLHMIELRWRQNRGAGGTDLAWKTPCNNEFEPIPVKNLYPLGKESLADNTVSSTTTCTKVTSIKALDNHLVDGFKPIPGKKMIASVWVKKGTGDCRCPQYDGFTIKLKNAANSNIATFQPKGAIIEGWQQFETVFDVPDAASMDFYIDNSSNLDHALFIDDLRMHPYSANMKSFVYHPVTLKPMAELDENNYASFYEYDDDGTLIRVKKETIKGIKTIQETRSGLQKTITTL